MAYINSEWYDREARADRISLIESRVEKLTKLYEVGHLLPSQVDTLISDKKELIRLKRIHRAEHDVLYFGMEYFSEDGNPGNPDNLIPSGVNVGNAAEFHIILTDLFDDVARGDRKSHTAYACPRSHGKTAWTSNIFLLHQVVFRHRRYIVLFSETTDVAGDFITYGRHQLKLNEKLRKDFGELLHTKASMNELDNKYEFITSSKTKVEAKGLQVQARGLRHGSTRPDLFILDDLESSESTNTPELIEKSKRWFREEMLPALSKDGICIYIGTILCHGSLLHHVIDERKDFKSEIFGAVKSFSDRTDLWEQWRQIYREDTKDSVERAKEFFEENREAMLEGTDVLWEDMKSYYELMVIREESGAKAFSQEFQNSPTDEERQIFKPEYFTYFDEDDLEGKNISFYAGIDFAMGKETGDYSVIATVAKNVDTGTCYVYDLFMERVHPDVLLQKAVEYTLKYQYEGIGVEAQQAQEWFADKLTNELQINGYPGHTRVKQIKQRTRKTLRIESMLPDIQSGALRFNRRLPREYFDQFELFGMHAHDDGPDGTHMAYTTAKEGGAVVRTVRRMQRW